MNWPTSGGEDEMVDWLGRDWGGLARKEGDWLREWGDRVRGVRG